MAERFYHAGLRATELHGWCDRLLVDDALAVAECVAFLEAETRGYWHGRARAQMARRLKHCTLTADQQTRLVQVILDRMARGQFSQQFRDQLRLVLHLDPTRAYALARTCGQGVPQHVQRVAAYLLRHEEQHR